VAERARTREDAGSLTGPTNVVYVAVAENERWIFGAGKTPDEALDAARNAEDYFDDEFVIIPASQTLAIAVARNGYEIPAFWKLVDGVACHEAELRSV
jgi:hypothetical protein